MTQWKVCLPWGHDLGKGFFIMTDYVQSKLTLPDEVSALDSTSAKTGLKLGLFSYPVLQAADILLYGYGFFPWSSFSSLTFPALLMFQ